ncbi:MAG: pyridoxamine kinase [Lachnospiraceae bacterium]|nr:pyridoxamine kinase [Lachnospiraceae bacterium]
MEKRVLTIQDISCVGRCSLTVALPIISACGIETSVLPSAVLSTHTGGFTGYTFRDLSDDMPAIKNHWVKESIKFDAIYTGYLGSVAQIDYVLDIMKDTLTENGVRIVDPAMADNGKLYAGFDEDYVQAMKRLCASADFILPNITEACMFTGYEYREEYDEAYIKGLIDALGKISSAKIVLTGVSYDKATTGVVVCEDGSLKYYRHKRFEKSYHGTGDVYASAFVGAYMRGHSAYDSAVIAADYTTECMRNTKDDKSKWYGVSFESAIKTLVERV